MSAKAFLEVGVGPWKIWHSPAVRPEGLIQEILPSAPGDLRRQEFVQVQGVKAYLKASPLATGSARRHSLARWTIGRPYPRVREALNLHWLRRHLFHAPRPLAAGVYFSNGFARGQWLLTEALEGHVSWNEDWSLLSSEDQLVRAQVLAEEVARMHALGFLHHDLFPRNLMVPRGQPDGRIGFLDAWAGGPGFHLRGPAYDLGCLALDWPEHWPVQAQRSFLQTYQKARAQQDRPVKNMQALMTSAASARAKLRADSKMGWTPPTW